MIMDETIKQGLLRRHQQAIKLSHRQDIKLLRGEDFATFCRHVRWSTKIDHYVACCLYDIINGIDILAMNK